MLISAKTVCSVKRTVARKFLRLFSHTLQCERIVLRTFLAPVELGSGNEFTFS